MWFPTMYFDKWRLRRACAAPTPPLSLEPPDGVQSVT